MKKESLLEADSEVTEYYMGQMYEEDGILSIQYLEHPSNAFVHIIADISSVEIKRDAEISSHLLLKNHETIIVSIDSPYGQIQMESYTEKIMKTNNFLFVEYRLMQQSEIIGHFKITWQILQEETA